MNREEGIAIARSYYMVRNSVLGNMGFKEIQKVSAFEKLTALLKQDLHL